jgi:hypothetical protein
MKSLSFFAVIAIPFQLALSLPTAAPVPATGHLRLQQSHWRESIQKRSPALVSGSAVADLGAKVESESLKNPAAISLPKEFPPPESPLGPLPPSTATDLTDMMKPLFNGPESQWEHQRETWIEMGRRGDKTFAELVGRMSPEDIMDHTIAKLTDLTPV